MAWHSLIESPLMSHLNEYLSEKRAAVLARSAAIAAGTAQAARLKASVRAEGRSGVRRLRIREHQVISDSPPDFAGFNLGPSSPELQLGVLGTCVTHIFEIQAALLQVPLDSIEVDVRGTIDPRGGHPGHEPLGGPVELASRPDGVADVDPGARGDPRADRRERGHGTGGGGGLRRLEAGLVAQRRQDAGGAGLDRGHHRQPPARLDRLEEQLQLCLPDVYKELNEILRRHDIAPTAPKIVQREGSGNTPISQAAGGTIENQSTRNSVANTGTPGNNAFAALQQAVKNQFAANELFPPELTPGVFAENTSRQAPAGAGTNFTLDASSVVMLNQLMERLRVLELQQMTGLSNFSLGETGSESGNEAPLHVLKSKDLDLPLGTPASSTISQKRLAAVGVFAACLRIIALPTM